MSDDTDSKTEFLGLTKPVVGEEAGEDLWGEKLNANFDLIDEGWKTLEQSIFVGVTEEQLAEEEATRAAADVVLQQGIDDEAVARANADNTALDQLDTEAGIRLDADNNLQSQITAKAPQSQLEAEATTRAAVDADLQIQVDDRYTKAQANSRFIDASGDAMGGPLLLAGEPTVDLEAATKHYVDNLSVDAYTKAQADVRFIDAAGDTMTGALTLAGDPSADLQAATKLYVDAAVGGGFSYFDYMFNDAQFVAPPNSGRIRTNNVNQTLATKLWLSDVTYTNNDADNLLDFVVAGTKLFLQNKSDATKWQRYRVTAAADLGAYHEFDVVWEAGGAALPSQRVGVVINPGGSSEAGVIVGTDPPTVPIPNSLWWESDSGNLYLRFDDGSSVQWVQVNGSGGADYVAKIGDTMTGDLTISKTAAALTINASEATGGGAFYWNQASKNRWVLYTSPDAGNHFLCARYNDAGTFIDQPLTISRATGGATFSGTLTCTNGSVYSQASVGGNAHYWLLNEAAATKGVLFWDRTTDNVVLRNSANNIDLTLTAGGIVNLGKGQSSRQGSAGAYTGSSHNWYWSGAAIQAWVDATNVGNVSLVCDYRIKKDVEPLESTWDQVKALRPVSFTHADYSIFKSDEIPRWGFLAHELQETLVESAATGKKNEEHVIQSPDPMSVIAALTKALQEAMTRIEALEAR